MKKNLFLASLFALCSVSGVYAQADSSGKSSSVVHPSKELYAPMIGTVDLINVQSNFNPVLQSIEVEDQSNADGTTIGALLPRQAVNFQEDVSQTNGAANKLAATPAPTIVSQFNGFSDNAYTPPDDNIAVSNGGYVITVINSIYRIFKPNATAQYKASDFADALKSTFPSITGVYYDPRVIYDAEADRFILVVLNGITSTTSEIVVLFSKDNNPADGWNGYAISGDIYSKGEWADYPDIGISKDDLFITNNLFDDNQNYIEPSILQIGKSAGYSGASSLAYRSWEPQTVFNVLPTLFTLVPATQGQGSDYGDSMYFVSNKFQGGTTLTVFKLTGDEASSSSSLNSSVVSYKTLTASTPTPTGSSQKSSSNTLNQGDSRIKQAFYLNGLIHYVFSTKDATTGSTDLVYTRLNPATNILNYKALGATGFNYVYPSLASYGSNANSPAVMIGYCKAGTSIYPEVDAVECDSSFTFTPSVTIYAGQAAVGGSTSQLRWGDYTCMARQYSGKNCYFSGSYGYATAYETEIAVLGPNSSGIEPVAVAIPQNISIFPNPVLDRFNLDFDMEQKSHITIAVNDMRGKRVVLLFDGVTPAGDQSFSFNQSSLSPGMYVVTITNGDETVASRKIVVK